MPPEARWSFRLGHAKQPEIGKIVDDAMAAAKDRSADVLGHVLTPGRYVGLPEEEDDYDFVERFTALKAEFESQVEEEARPGGAIAANLAKIEMPTTKGVPDVG